MPYLGASAALAFQHSDFAVEKGIHRLDLWQPHWNSVETAGHDEDFLDVQQRQLPFLEASYSALVALKIKHDCYICK